MKSSVREYFPGANTPMGFYSYYDNILKSREANRIVILKGGPGTGKSSFMKRVAKHLVMRGHETELLHCSSDPDSLDGVCARDIGFLILDGTAPHIVDPKVPGAVDEIINLGICWDKDKIFKNKNSIIDTNEQISKTFQKAYDYLAAAKNIQNHIYRDMCFPVNDDRLEDVVDKIRKTYSIYNKPSSPGFERKAFLSAITHLGKKGYADSFIQHASHTYKIKSDAMTTYALFEKLKQLFILHGYEARTFYSPMSPDNKIEHLYVPEFNIFFTIDAHPNTSASFENENETEIKVGTSAKMSDSLCDDTELYNSLIERAISDLSHAKKLHDELEKYYIPYMDFGKVQNLCQNLIDTL